MMTTPSYWLLVHDYHIYLPYDAIPFGTAEQWGFSTEHTLKIAEHRQYSVYFLLDFPKTLFSNENEHFKHLRSQLTRPIDEFYLLSRAIGLVQFFQAHQFCPACATPLQFLIGQVAKVCPHCQRQYFPRINPSIIVAVRKGRQILLARHHRHHQKNVPYTVLAGFVEIGETIEQAVHREVFEESQIKIKNLQYISSQSWSFPNSLMLGFLAEYDTGEIQVQQEELQDAQWFDLENLPKNLPEHGTIARTLIELTQQAIK